MTSTFKLAAGLAATLLASSSPASAQSFMQKGTLVDAAGPCGTNGLPPLFQSWTYYGPSFTSTYGEVYNDAKELIGICKDVQPPDSKGNFAGAGNAYRGGCVEGADWGNYPCHCDAVFRNNSNYKLICDVTTPEGKTVQCSASFAVSAI